MLSINNNLNKIEGGIIVINTLLPVIIFIGIIYAVSYTWDSVKCSISDYLSSVTTIIDHAEMTKDDINDLSENIIAHATSIKKEGEKIVNGIGKSVKKFNKAVNKIETSFSKIAQAFNVKARIPLPHFPDWMKIPRNFNINIPLGDKLAKPIESIGKQIAKPFNVVKKPINNIKGNVRKIKQKIDNIDLEIKQLQAMEVYLDLVIREYKNSFSLINNMIDTVKNIMKFIGYILAGLFIWFSTSYVFWFRNRIKRGYALLVG